MLASDVVLNVRASRSLSSEEIDALERLLFSKDGPSPEQVELLSLINSYVSRPSARWSELMARARRAIAPAGTTEAASAA